MRKTILLVMALILSGTVLAGPIEMAHEAGFTGCDSAINKELKVFLEAGNGYITIDYDDVKMKNVISLLTTFGSNSSSVLQKITIINNNNSCVSFVFTQITSAKNCIEYKEENPDWKFVAAQADNIWTKNKGGSTSILKNLPQGGCIISFNRVSSGY